MSGRELDLAEVLARHRDEIVALWTARAAAILGERLEGNELQNGVPALVDAIARHLGGEGDAGGSPTQPIARHHARQRREVGIDLARMLREYGLLRGAILEVAERRGAAPLATPELRALGEALDAALAAGADEYVSWRDETGAEVEERFRAVADHAPVAMFLKDSQGRYVFANRWVASLLGLTPEQVVGRTITDILPPDVVARTRQREAQAAAGEAFSEDAIPTPRGERVLVTVRFPFRISAEEVGTFGIAVDVTDRKRAEEALQTGQARARAILSNIRDAIVVLRAVRRGDGVVRGWRYVEANDGALEILGRGREEVVGRTLREVLPERAADLHALLARVLETGEPHRYEATHRGYTSLVTLFRVDATSVGSASFDISDRKRAEDALRAANDRLVDADRRKDEFLGMLSHELRNPLTPIRNSVHILQRAEPGSDQARRAREVIARQSDHLTRLVDDLLDVTRIASGKIALRRADVDVAEVVTRTAEDHRSLLLDRRIALDVDVPDAPLPASADPTRLAQIVGNLLQNAAKFTPAGGRVTVRVRAAGGRIELVVGDTGVGVEPSVRARIFDPFVQGDRTLARSGGGLGLGLALVRGLAELHGGGVAVESEGPGRGAQFTVWIPAAPAPARAPARAPEPAPGGQGGRRSVLVVDDNRDAAESLAELVAAFGHDVEIAHDGPSALERARARPHDFVLCDIGLPGMSGYDVARALRADPGAGFGRLVAVSGYAQPEDQRRASEAGFDLHVAKPPDPSLLERLLSA